jgi:DNA-binding transcriptional ArsR family regulator
MATNCQREFASRHDAAFFASRINQNVERGNFYETIRLRLTRATVWLHTALVMKRDVFQAIADPTRRAIIALIALQAMTPNAIAENFHTTRQAISKHLRILTECELVKQEQQGREIYYSLEILKMKEIDDWLEQYRKIWESRFDQLEDVLATINRKRGEK